MPDPCGEAHSAADWDVFISFTRADGRAEITDRLHRELQQCGLRVFRDERISFGDGITEGLVSELARSKLFLAVFSTEYPRRPACQWELTSAFLAAQRRRGSAAARIRVVNPEPDTSEHIELVQVQDTKLHPVPGSRREWREFAASIKRAADRFTTPLGPPPRKRPKVLPVEPAGNRSFVGRLPELWRVHSALTDESFPAMRDSAGRRPCALVTGTGGVGKTALAERYIELFGPFYPGGVYWLQLNESTGAPGGRRRDVPARFRTELSSVAVAMGHDVEGLDHASIRQLVARTLERAPGDVLWVVDDVPEGAAVDDVRELLAPAACGRTLITTRDRRHIGFGTEIAVGAMARDDAESLLAGRRRPGDAEEREQMRALIDELGGHAQALQVVARAMGRGASASYAEYRNDLRDPRWLSFLPAERLRDVLPSAASPDVAKVLLRAVASLSPTAREVLLIASLLAPAPIPMGYVRSCLSRLCETSFSHPGEPVAEALHDLDMTSLASTGDRLRVHALVARAIEADDADRYAAEKPRRLSVLTEELHALLSKPSTAATERAQLITHARHLTEVEAHSRAHAALLGAIADVDDANGDHVLALRYRERQVQAHAEFFAPRHPQRLRGRVALASTLEAVGRFEDARRACEEVLREREGATGPEHVLARHRIATVVSRLGDPFSAANVTRETVDYFRERGDYPVLPLVTERARVLLAAGELAKAQRVIDAGLRDHGDGTDELHLLEARTVRVAVRTAQGHVIESRSKAKNVVERFGELGYERHPSLLDALTAQAIALVITDWPPFGNKPLEQEAITLLTRVHGVRAESLGADNPLTLASAAVLGRTLVRGGSREQGLPILDATERRVQPLLGARHPVLLEARHWLAQGLLEDNQYHRARRVFEEVYEARRRILGPAHVATVETQCRLAVALAADGAPAQALRMATEAQRRTVVSDYRLRLELPLEALFTQFMSTAGAPLPWAYTKLNPLLDPARWPTRSGEDGGYEQD
ncbi:hypothetical protein GCM10027570_25140 [Streptomonospora sediminis]